MHSYEPPIAYRDLKPENIMIGIDGHIKLTDFGFAKFFGEEVDPFDAAGSPRRERSHSIVGSAFYIAPEIVNSSKAEGHDLSVDFWSFGCLIYEMVCGHALFADPKSEAMFQQMKKSGQISKGSTFQQFTMCVAVLHVAYLCATCRPRSPTMAAGTACSTPKKARAFPPPSANPCSPSSTRSCSATLICAARAGLRSNSTSFSRCVTAQSSPTRSCNHPHRRSQPIDFTKLLEKRIDPPFVPSLSKGYQDISMFEDASAVDISMSRPTNKHRTTDPGSPNTSQVQGFHFQAKTSQILTESAKKTRPFVDDSARAPRVVPSEVPTFANMRRSKSSESLDSVAKHAGSASPSIDPAQPPSLLAPITALESEKSQRSPNNSSRSDQSPVAAAAAPAATTPPAAAAAAAAGAAVAAAAAAPKRTPVELAADFLASCDWNHKSAAACLIEALADPKNPQLGDKKFQHVAALFSNEITTAIL
jgi:serine/threonine protein kinase